MNPHAEGETSDLRWAKRQTVTVPHIAHANSRIGPRLHGRSGSWPRVYFNLTKSSCSVRVLRDLGFNHFSRVSVRDAFTENTSAVASIARGLSADQSPRSPTRDRR